MLLPSFFFALRDVAVCDAVAKAGYDERWRALAKIFAMPTKKVAFNAQVGGSGVCLVWASAPPFRRGSGASSSRTGGGTCLCQTNGASSSLVKGRER